MACVHATAVMLNSKLDYRTAEYRVLMAIALHIGEGGEEAYVGCNRLAEMAHIKPPTVSRCIKKAVEKGELIVRHKAGHASRYTLGDYYKNLIEDRSFDHGSTNSETENATVKMLINEVREMKEMIAEMSNSYPPHTPYIPPTYPPHTPHIPPTSSRLDFDTKIEDRRYINNITLELSKTEKPSKPRKKTGQELLEKLIDGLCESEPTANAREIYNATYSAIKKHHPGYNPTSSEARKKLAESLPTICELLTTEDIKNGWEADDGFFHENGTLTSPKQISGFAGQYLKSKKSTNPSLTDDTLWDQVVAYVRDPNGYIDKESILNDNSNPIHNGLKAVGNGDFARGMFAIRNRDQYTTTKLKSTFLGGTKK